MHEEPVDAFEKLMTDVILPQCKPEADEFRMKYLYQEEMDEFLAENVVEVSASKTRRRPSRASSFGKYLMSISVTHENLLSARVWQYPKCVICCTC